MAKPSLGMGAGRLNDEGGEDFVTFIDLPSSVKSRSGTGGGVEIGIDGIYCGPMKGCC